MSTAMDGEETNWSEYVEDLVHEGKVEEAISHLESLVSKLETLGSSAPELDTVGVPSALSDLAQLYSTKGFSLKADEARSRARDLKIAKDLGQKCSAPSKASPSDGWSQDDGHVRLSSAVLGESLRSAECPDNGDLQKSSELAKTSLLGECLSDDDWEAVADLAPEELLPSQCLPEVSKLSLNEKVTKFQAPKQRGRGTFSYTTHGLYSNQQSDSSVVDHTEREAVCHSSEGDAPTRNLKYGTHHVLVLADFPPSTRTIDLEKLLESFKDHGVVIRWVNDTVALAVFRTPTIALEACSQIKCAFTVRVLDENDTLLSSIPSRDLDPPRQRPQTSARTARRLIAQGMGIKLPTTNFSSKELQQQEVARRNRIVSRQHMRDDAWGGDGN